MANPTIKTIAEEAGVSVATVSKALNDMPDISEPVKQRIRAIAQKQGYILNTAARQLASGEAFSVGVILPDVAEPNIAEVYRAFALRFVHSNYSIYLNDSAYSVKNEAEIALKMLQKRVGALVVMTVTTETRHIEEVVRGQIPVVYIGGAVNPNVENGVLSDEYSGGQIAARHLYRAGHRNSVVFTSGTAATAQYERMRGFTSYMQEHRARVQVLGADAGVTGEEAGRQLAGRLSELGEVITAVFCTNDIIAIGAMGALKEQGVAIPDDISIVGFGDIPPAAYALIRLTTVRPPKQELGIVTGDLALSLMKGEKDVLKRVTLQPRLERRATVKQLNRK